MTKPELVRLLPGSHSAGASPMMGYPDPEKDGWIYVVGTPFEEDLEDGLVNCVRYNVRSLASGRECIIWDDDWEDIVEENVND